MKTKYTVLTAVRKIEEFKSRDYLSGVGEAATFRETSLGWYLHLEGSRESIFLGYEKPELDAGDKIKITIEKA